MLKRLAVVGAFTTLISSAAVAPAAAQVGVSIAIGHPVHQVDVGPYSGYVWQPEHYVWTAYGYQLVPGAWVPGPYAAPDAYYAPQYYAPRYYGSWPYYYGWPGLSFGLHFGNGHGHSYGRGYGYGAVRGYGYGAVRGHGYGYAQGRGYGHGNVHVNGHGNGHGHR